MRVGSTSTSSLLETAVVKASVDRRETLTRALLDGGATLTLVTCKLATTLGAKKIPSRVEIKGVDGSLISDHVVELTLSSAYKKDGEQVTLDCHVVDHIDDVSANGLSEVSQMPFLRGKQLADPGRGSHLDLLIGMTDIPHCYLTSIVFSANKTLEARESIFGWVVRGNYSHRNNTPVVLKASAADDKADIILQRLWHMEEMREQALPLTEEEMMAIDHFKEHMKREADGRYSVSLPRKLPVPSLGESRQTALRRFNSNQRSLQKKGTWPPFEKAVQEYIEMDHAEKVPPEDLHKPLGETYYLPMHGVTKDSSTTTKLRIVFDASAKTSTGVSLNNTLLSGPSLYPSLTSVLTRFRCHQVGMSADISKMFREVALNEEERDFHRFLFGGPGGEIQDYRMKRLTFGVTSSPYLATQVLRQAADDHQSEYPEAADIIRSVFYVDDVLTGADSVEAAVKMRAELNHLLDHAQMKLRKWRSNSAELLETIPKSLRENDGLNISAGKTSGSKTLGVYWKTLTDTLHISVPLIDIQGSPTKREVASAAARVFDVLGWFAPAVVWIKILLQKIWELGLEWDKQIPEHLCPSWEKWKTELPAITKKGILRRYYHADKEVVDTQLHGFSDASMSAYGGVVYLRIRYADTTISVSLVAAKTRVAPLKRQTIPKLELCAALLTARLLATVAEDLSLDSSKAYAWTDSSIVLEWLNSTPSRLKVYVANRDGDIVSKVSAIRWRYVTTECNPADFASRGLLPEELVRKELWWDGPPWLQSPPDQWPLRADLTPIRELPELRGIVMTISAEQQDLWAKYSSYKRLLRVCTWCLWFIHRIRDKNEVSTQLTTKDLSETETRLLKLSQREYYLSEIDLLTKGKPVSNSSSILSLQPLLGDDGLLRVGGRLQHVKTDNRHPIILKQKSPLVKLIVTQLHLDNGHVGPNTLLAIIAETYHITGVRRVVRSVSQSCVVCKKAYARTVQQQMGQLPSARVNPSPAFTVTGVDLAGPFLCHRGNPRKPTRIKTYACVFVCFSTRAIHLELLSDMSTQAFLAGFRRFCSRRGCPSLMYSDNGTNFVGADRELREAKQALLDNESIDIIIREYPGHLDWKFSPSSAPHFGGLWEAGVRAMKGLLRKKVGKYSLSFEDLTTVLAEAESILNSRPLTSPDSLPTDGTPLLTPGHFLIGRPLRAPPIKVDTTNKITLLKRWNLVSRLTHDLWQRWKKEYLQSLQTRRKWIQHRPNLCVGDIVLLKEAMFEKQTWPLARIEEVFTGDDGLVRVVAIRCGNKIYRRPVHKLVLLLHPAVEGHFCPPEDVRASSPPRDQS